MTIPNLSRSINVPAGSPLSHQDYKDFLNDAYHLIRQQSLYLTPSEDINAIELAHLIPSVPETVLALYVSINDAVCNKALVSPFLVRHGHNSVFVFDPQIYSGGENVPAGTIDVQAIINGFEPPNSSWSKNWTYIMIQDPSRTFESLWKEKGYIDLIPAKFEDFTALTEVADSMVCIFIDPKAFEHPVNAARDYLNDARNRGEKLVDEFAIPKGLEGETQSLVPVVLNKGEKLYVATKDFGPCHHAWSNIHPDNKHWAVVNENSAVPLGIITSKPPVNSKYAKNLIPPGGSADMTTDWFYRNKMICRTPLLCGLVKG